VKSTFTRNFNKASHLLHYTNSAVARKRSRSLLQDEYNNGGEGTSQEMESEEENESIDKIKAIKKSKGKSTQGSNVKRKKTQ